MGTEGEHSRFDENLESPFGPRWTDHRSWWSGAGIAGHLPTTGRLQDLRCVWIRAR